MAESRLDSVVDDSLVCIDGYTLVRQDRNVEGGGVALYVRDTFTVKILEQSTTNVPGRPMEPEYIICSVQQSDSPPVMAAVIYRPPHVGFFANKLDEHLRSCGEEYSHKIIMGDLNANLLSTTDQDARVVRRLASNHALSIVQHEATHHTDTSSTWIDVILVDRNDKIISSNCYPAPYRNGHNVIDVTIELFLLNPAPVSFSYRDYKRVHPDALASTLSSYDWTYFDSDDFDLHTGLNILNTHLTSAIETLAPLKVVKGTKDRPPWMTQEIQELTKSRDATLRRYLRTRQTTYMGEFNQLRDRVNLLSEQARRQFYQEKISYALDHNPNGVWHDLRKLGLLRKESQSLHGMAPEALNAHFASVSTSASESSANYNEVLSQATDDGFKFKEIDFSDVVLAVKHFSTQARGSDEIPQCIVAKSLPFLGPYLVRVINASLSSGTFPEPWRESQLLPLRKTATPSAVKDFRPIALLCFLSKVLEKIVHDQISMYLKQQNIQDPLQTAYRQYNSTQTALLRLTDDIRMGIDKRKMTVLLLFDFSKAFDTISPYRLLKVMQGMGFSRTALCWISTYMTGRRQRVITQGNDPSDWIYTNLGVPQGSVLGPLLFSLYINDLQLALRGEGVRHIFYADDLQVYAQVGKDELENGIATLSRAASIISRWANSIGLKLNASKTKAMMFGSRKNINDIPNDLPCPNLDGVSIPFVDKATNLGVIMDSKLSWRPQVEAVACRVKRALYCLRFFRCYTTPGLRKRLVSAMALSHLDYCSVVYLDASNELKLQIQRLQNACARYVTGVARDQHITPSRRQLGWLKTDTRRMYFSAILMYKILRIREPPYLAELFSTRQSRCPARGISGELAIPHFRTETGRWSFQIHCATFWNSLPPLIRNAPSLASFKHQLYAHLFSIDAS